MGSEKDAVKKTRGAKLKEDIDFDNTIDRLTDRSITTKDCWKAETILNFKPVYSTTNFNIMKSD